MLTPLYLLFGLTAATCVIAYWADNLGKKLGKKRISLFNLRPRQTATLISMASSVGIMILTLAAQARGKLRDVKVALGSVRSQLGAATHKLTAAQRGESQAQASRARAEQ